MNLIISGFIVLSLVLFLPKKALIHFLVGISLSEGEEEACLSFVLGMVFLLTAMSLIRYSLL
uniref:hypothetical protein n=1 Tax=Enterococcus faecalis TaxID=1351 RepID=UPI00041A51C2|nr:hypothetical protein [Enterococcus faecalis]